MNDKYTFRLTDKFHGYVMRKDGNSQVWVCTASLKDCERIAEAMNRQEREDGEGKGETDGVFK